MIDDTAMESPETLSEHEFRLATKWAEIQRVVDAAVVDDYGRGMVPSHKSETHITTPTLLNSE